MKDENDKYIDVEVKFTVEDVRRVLEFQDTKSDPIQVPERLCKGLWFRMGYSGFVNDMQYLKSKLSKPYKFLVHSAIHALHHRKGGFDVSADFIMFILTCLILNRLFNISQVIFNHMVDSVHGEKFLQYPRFIQMLLDDQIANVPKEADDELVLEHMDNETLRRLNIYQGQEDGPPDRRKFATIKTPDYIPQANDKWRHENPDSGTEDEKLSLLVKKRSKFWLKDNETKKKKRTPTQRTPKASTPKAATKRTTKKKTTPTTPRLVDEPSEDEAQHVDENVEGGDVGSTQPDITFGEIEDIIVYQDVIKKAKNAEKASGETIGEILVEGVVYTDSNETESEIDLTQIAPTTGHNGKRGRKAWPPRKRKNSDDEDASYVPSAAEVEKIKKGRGRLKRSSQPADDVSRKHKIRKTTAKAVKATSGKSVQVPVERFEIAEVEVMVVQSEFHIATPPTSPIQENIPVQTELHVTPPQQPQNIEEPGLTTKKATTPRQQGSGLSFLDIPDNLGTGPTRLEDTGDIPFFNDERVDAVAKRVAELEKSKGRTDEKLKASDAKLKEIDEKLKASDAKLKEIDEKLKASDEKLKNVEAENVVLKNEVLALNEKVEELQAGNNALIN
ncbi:hypothetical protein HanRHA438_Chr11g0492541 [Helianthus annuus]|nr:hypothetical protein HanHA300_Chr11g0392911 [Helianthus annuus]KAJ0688571.1 hypothetical protein HanOQP8_Chr11g0395761 [Helianthus annuus]KAJ0869753.1 hypothetical protein HanRHA438_Chr11g0492541 [Helianthus annuus]